jgi:hypothetical protein
MRRAVFAGLGLLELTAAGLLIVLGLKLPDGAEVRITFKPSPAKQANRSQSCATARTRSSAASPRAWKRGPTLSIRP